MQAIIFNSGLGSRMGGLTKSRPKGLLDVCGETLFERQLKILSGFDISEFIVTTGKYEREFAEVSDKFPHITVTYVNNPLYESTNYIYSLHLAREYIKGDILLLHGDLYFSLGAAKRLINSPHADGCLINKDIPLPEKDFKARLSGDIIREISVDLSPESIPRGQTAAALQPFYKLSRGLAGMWLDKVSEFADRGNVKAYAENALNELLHAVSLYGVSYGNEFITEIDTAEDYERVRDEAMHR